MNRNKFYIILIFLIVSLTYISDLYSQSDYLTNAEAKKDLEVFIDVYNHHPGLFTYRSESDIDTVKHALMKNLPDSISLNDFYLKLLQPLVFLKDGHTGLSLGDRYSNIKKSDTTLPFKYKIINDKIYVIESFSDEADDFLFSQLISINSIPTDSLLNYFYQFTTSDNNNGLFRQRYNERIFGQNFDFFIENINEYLIEGLTPEGDTVLKKINGIEDYELKVNSTLPSPLSYSFDKEKNLAILTVNTFDYRRIVSSGIDFHEFIDNFFKEVRKKNSQDVVIDLRENYGGSGGLAMSLYAYLAMEDFKWIDYSLTFLDGTEKFAQYTEYPDGQYPFLSRHDTVRVNHKLRVTNGLDSKAVSSSTHIPFGPKMKVKDISKNKFNGNVYVLTSGITFSAGSIFTSKCTEREKTVLIGESPGSAGGIFCGGGYLKVTLPNSGFKFLLPIMERHIAFSNNNINSLEPITPDYWINTSLSDIIEGIDPELEQVYKLIGN